MADTHANAAEKTVSRHYTHGSLETAIRDALVAVGKDPAALAPADLAPVDEFHIGGREATEHFAQSLGLTAGMRLLDIGCGIGGAARYFAAEHGAMVTGIDLTEEYVQVAAALADWVGLSSQAAFHQTSALSRPFEPSSFEVATMLHVGMNIADKAAVFAEAARVLAPGGRMGVYDVMRVGDGDLAFPVPWAADESTSFLAAPETYQEALTGAGLEIAAVENRGDFALSFFDRLRAQLSGQDGPPPLGLHILMGADAQSKVANMIRNVETGVIAPVELIARKPD
jgi:2-polyprenyl-3-methyl-5-hydroxy-6-metoxy-1,4-benzoquinol methylase